MYIRLATCTIQVAFDTPLNKEYIVQFTTSELRLQRNSRVQQPDSCHTLAVLLLL